MCPESTKLVLGSALPAGLVATHAQLGTARHSCIPHVENGQGKLGPKKVLALFVCFN